MEQEILSFLKNKEPKLCVLATVTAAGKPECAVMGYAVSDDLSLVLSTDKTSRKWQNLKLNQSVALNFGWSFEELNVQYEGVATSVGSGDLFTECEEKYFSVHSEALEFKDLPETVFVNIKPIWVRLSDYSVTPPRILEKQL